MTSTRAKYLAIDQGGHASRAMVFDGEGRIVSHARREVETLRIGPDRVEQDADAVAESIRNAAVEAIGAIGSDARGITCAGLATQRSSVVCWDRESGEALSPILSWQDRRAASWLTRLAPNADDIRARTGLRLSPHYGASKLRWCMDHLPAVEAARLAGVMACGPLASFLLFRMLEERPLLVDTVNASRTLLWSIATHDWDDHLIGLFGLPRDVLPSCVPTHHPFGHLAVGGRRIPFRVCTGDQAAAIFAAGPPADESCYINIGTGAFAQCVTRDPFGVAGGLLVGTLGGDGDEWLYALEGPVNGAGSALQFVGDELGVDQADVTTRLESWLDAIDDPPLFLNGVGGLAAPFWVADFPSSFRGGGTTSHKMVAVCESIVFLLATVIDEMSARPEGLPGRIVVSGGLSRLDGLCRRLATITGLEVVRPAATEATARGVACQLAGLPTQWTRGGRTTSFLPQEGRSLRRRYATWSCLMRERVARCRDSGP